jgi:hypothetical protein
MTDKPETVKFVRTQGGYAVFVSPSAHPVAVFTSGYDLLDWVATHIASWEAGVAKRAPAKTEGAGEDEEDGGPDAAPHA